MTILDPFGSLRAIIDQRIDPFAALVLGRLRRIQRKVRSRQAAFHHLDVMHRHANLGRDHLTQLMLVQGLARGLGLSLKACLYAAHVEEQRFLRGRRAGAHHRPVAHDVVLNARLDPPDGIGGKAHPAVGVEFVGSFHQAQSGLLDQIIHRRAIALELTRHRDS